MPTIDEAAVKVAGGKVLPDGAGITLHGWRIITHKAPITRDADTDAVKAQLGGAVALPEQLFGSSYLSLTHEASGICLQYNALDALRAWRAESAPAVRVGAAASWMAVRARDVAAHNASTLEYDWTYTSGYAGSVAAAAANSATAGPAAGAGQQVQWVDAGAAQLDRALLTARDPILLYDEVPLYESELDDFGTSQLTVKVRVMPRCWYVLLRFYLRVDGVLVRLREARTFAAFSVELPHTAAVQTPLAQGATAPPSTLFPSVLREVRWSEGTFEQLRAAGAAPEGRAWADADGASVALAAIAPVAVQRYFVERLQPVTAVLKKSAQEDL